MRWRCLSFAIPGLLTAMAWIFVLSPNIGWVNAMLKSMFGLKEAPLSIYTMGGMIWALSSHYFPLAYLALGPALARARRADGGGGAGFRRALLAGDAQDHAAAAAAGDPLDGAAAVHARHVVLRGAAADRTARAHRRLHHRDPGRDSERAAGIRHRERAQLHAACASASSRSFSTAARRATPRPSRPSPARATCRRGSSCGSGAGRYRSRPA